MSDFDESWNISGLPSDFTSKPDTVQPAQPAESVQPVQQQPQPAIAQVQQPVQPQMPIQAVQPQYVQPAQPQFAQPVMPQYGQPVQAPVQPQYYQPAQPQYPQYGQPVAQPMPVQPQMAPQYVPQYQVPMMNAAYVQNTLAERNANIEELNKMINHFSPKLSLFQEYEDYCAKMRNCLNPNVAPLIFGSITGFIFILLLIMTIGAKSQEVMIRFLISMIACGLLSGGLFFLFFMMQKKHKAELEGIFPRIGELSNQIQVLYNGYGSSVIPPEFSDPRILFKIRYLLITGKALTIKDALSSLLFRFRQNSILDDEKKVFSELTSEKLDGKPAFFNALRFLDVR